MTIREPFVQLEQATRRGRDGAMLVGNLGTRRDPDARVARWPADGCARSAQRNLRGSWRSAARDAIDRATGSAGTSLRYRLGRTDSRAGSGAWGSYEYLAHCFRGLAGRVATITIDDYGMRLLMVFDPGGRSGWSGSTESSMWRLGPTIESRTRAILQQGRPCYNHRRSHGSPTRRTYASIHVPLAGPPVLHSSAARALAFVSRRAARRVDSRYTVARQGNAGAHGQPRVVCCRGRARIPAPRLSTSSVRVHGNLESQISGSKSVAHVPSTNVPRPAVSAGPGRHFNRRLQRPQPLSRDRTAGSGLYANTQFSLEPPDQALCVSDLHIVESVNTVLRVRDKATGAPLTPAIPINQFFGLAPSVRPDGASLLDLSPPTRSATGTPTRGRGSLPSSASASTRQPGHSPEPAACCLQ